MTAGGPRPPTEFFRTETMTRRYAALACLALFALAAPSRADNISVGVTPTVVNVNSGQTGGTMTVTIANDVNNDPSTSFMRSWKLDLVVASDQGASGTVTFNSP